MPKRNKILLPLSESEAVDLWNALHYKIVGRYGFDESYIKIQKRLIKILKQKGYDVY